MFNVFASHHAIRTQLNRIEAKLDALLRSTAQMAKQTDQNFADLEAKVTNIETVDASAVTLLQGLKAALDAAIAANANGDSEALPALSARLGTSADALAAAVVANTPAAPTP